MDAKRTCSKVFQTKRTGQEDTNLLLLMTVNRYLTQGPWRINCLHVRSLFVTAKHSSVQWIPQFGVTNKLFWTRRILQPTHFLITNSTSLKKLHSSNSSLYLIPICVYSLTWNWKRKRLNNEFIKFIRSFEI